MSDLDAPFIEWLAMYPDEDSAVRYLEKVRWPNGPHCPKCNTAEVRIGATRNRRRHWYCPKCRLRFTVTVGTVMESTKIPLRSWLVCMHMMAGARKGISALHLSRILNLTYRSAWFLCHRIRFAMQADPKKRATLKGIVESDETYIGGTRKHMGRGYVGNKAAVQTIVERDRRGHRGQSKTIILHPDEDEGVDGRTVGAKLRMHTNLDKSTLMTDESPIYTETGKAFAGGHHTVCHKKEEYVRVEPSGLVVSTNTAEGLFANLKRQITGTHHHTSKRHLPRYLEEFDFKRNHREISDGARALLAVQGAEGKRLTLYKARSFNAPYLRARPTPRSRSWSRPRPRLRLRLRHKRRIAA